MKSKLPREGLEDDGWKDRDNARRARKRNVGAGDEPWDDWPQQKESFWWTDEDFEFDEEEDWDL